MGTIIACLNSLSVAVPHSDREVGMTGFRNRWAFSLMVAHLIGVAAAPPLSRALEPPRPGEVERFRKSREWEPRRAFAWELGNRKIRPGRLIEALRKARRAALRNRLALAEKVVAAAKDYRANFNSSDPQWINGLTLALRELDGNK